MTKNKIKMITFISLLLSIVTVLSIGVNYLHAKAVDSTTSTQQSASLDIEARAGLLMDASTGTIVYEKNSKEHMPIASMVKIMTLLLTFEQIDAGNLTLQTQIPISENASSMGGSQAFLDANNSYVLDELIKTIVVSSANDSCVAVAEYIAGSVEGFVDLMNAKANALGMTNSNFINCTGLPAPNQYSCANDVGLMTKALINHKNFFDYSKVWMFDFAHPSGRTTQLSNTNRLIRSYDGCDGGKTGFTNEAKFCLSATAKRGETRFISIVMGAETSKVRNAQNIKLFNYGFANYETKQVVFKGKEVDGEFVVSGSKEKVTKVQTDSDLFVFMPKNSSKNIEQVINVTSLSAPVKQGDVVGDVTILVDGVEYGKVDVVSSFDINKIKYMDVVDEMISNW